MSLFPFSSKERDNFSSSNEDYVEYKIKENKSYDHIKHNFKISSYVEVLKNNGITVNNESEVEDYYRNYQYFFEKMNIYLFIYVIQNNNTENEEFLHVLNKILNVNDMPTLIRIKNIYNAKIKNILNKKFLPYISIE